MRCLYIVNSTKIGGGNRSMLTLWEGLRGTGAVEPCVVCPGEGPMADAIREAGHPCVIHPYQQPDWAHPIKSLRNLFAWHQILCKIRPDLVHANSLDSARSIVVSTRRKRIPLVCHVRFVETDDSLEWMFRRLPKPDTFIFNSNALQGSNGPGLLRAAPDSPQVVIHNAVDTRVFRPRPRPGSPPRVGILANFMPVKRHEDFLLMAQSVLEKRPDAEFWLIGDDIHGTGREDALRRLAEELGIASQVKFLGHRQDVAGALVQLTAVVCTSSVEPFGRCLIESMACGRPVVATSVGGVPEVVQHGETGFLVAPGDVDALSKAVLRLIDEPALWQRMSDAGIQDVQNRFSIEQHARETLAVYEELVKPVQRAVGEPTLL
jgi:glycosyltransferase involved in cell wall biosynthesis